MILSGYVASVFIGISLGLIGGGGSILTVPVLVYLFGIDASLATVYSLFVVGTTSAVGSVNYFKKGLVDIRTAVFFGIPSIVAIFFTRQYILPLIPAVIFSAGDHSFTRNMLLMLLFALLMIAASYSMIRKENTAGPQTSMSYRHIFLQGIFTGMVTGLIGAGGGFLIIPALVNFLRLPMKTAIGTSLLIISVNSLTGFLFSLHNNAVHWNFLLSIAALAVAGIVIGSKLSTKIKSARLKTAFGWFVLVMGIYIILKETFFK